MHYSSVEALEALLFLVPPDSEIRFVVGSHERGPVIDVPISVEVLRQLLDGWRQSWVITKLSQEPESSTLEERALRGEFGSGSTG